MSLVPVNFSKSVVATTSDTSFCEQHVNKGAPLAMLAFATAVMDTVSKRNGNFDHYFDGLIMTVPPPLPCEDNNPQCHSIVGQKLLLVDWSKTHGIQVPCLDADCCGVLVNVRTNISKNKTLFQIFRLTGPPSWCMVQSMVCDNCSRKYDLNGAAVLLGLPPHAAEQYPVEIKYAISNKRSHLSRTTTQLFGVLMLTYGNGEMCSKILYNSINMDYLHRVKVYYSYAAACGRWHRSASIC